MHSLENWSAGTNKAVEMARQQYQAILKERHKNEKWDMPDPINTQSNDKEYYTCTNCVRYDDNHKLYHKDDMLHIKGEYNRGGRMKKYWRHLCPRHAEKYKPHSERGGLNLSY